MESFLDKNSLLITVATIVLFGYLFFGSILILINLHKWIGSHLNKKMSVEKIIKDNTDYSYLYGKRCVAIPNMYHDPIFFIPTKFVPAFEYGQVKYYLVGKELVHKKDITIEDKIIVYPDNIYLAKQQVIEAILKLTPYERFLIMKTGWIINGTDLFGNFIFEPLYAGFPFLEKNELHDRLKLAGFWRSHTE